MGLSLPHLIVVAVIVLVLFGRGRISEMMGDFGKGIRSFKDGMNEDVPDAARPSQPPPPQIAPPQMAAQRADAVPPVAAPTSTDSPSKPVDPAN